MAQGNTLVFAILFVVVAMVSTFAPTVLAQDFAPASEKGAACSAAFSGATILASLFLSTLALLKH
jgi:hypothetical protein